MLWRVPKVLTCSDVQNRYPQVTNWWDSPARNAELPVSEGRAGCPSPPDYSPRGRLSQGRHRVLGLGGHRKTYLASFMT